MSDIKEKTAALSIECDGKREARSKGRTATTSRELRIGGEHEIRFNVQAGTLVMGANSTLDAYLSNVTLGVHGGNCGVLDLRLASVRRSGDLGVFRANSLRMAIDGQGDGPRYNSEILLGSSLSSFEVASTLTIADGHRTSAWIGQFGGNGTAPFPDGADIKLGVSHTSRAAVRIGIGNYWGVSGHLVAGNGGDFTGYLSSLTVGTKADGGGESASGRLDVRNMDTVMLDVSGNTVIGSSYDASKQGYGRVHLGPGTATFRNLTIGHSWGQGLLDLYETDVTVTNALTVNTTGMVTTRVRAAGGSLALNGLTLDFHPESLALCRMAVDGARVWLDNGVVGAPIWQVRLADARGRIVELDGAAAGTVAARPRPHACSAGLDRGQGLRPRLAQRSTHPRQVAGLAGDQPLADAAAPVAGGRDVRPDC